MSLDPVERVRRSLLAGAELRQRAAETLAEPLAEVAGELARRLAAGGILYFFGN